MYCRECGQEVSNFEQPCEHCGKEPLLGFNYCHSCGNPTKEDQIVCTGCYATVGRTGKHIPVDPNSTTFTDESIKLPQDDSPIQGNHQRRQTRGRHYDQPEPLANAASFCCSPIIGIVLYFVWKEERPVAADSICHWTIAAIIINVLLYIISIFAGIMG